MQLYRYRFQVHRRTGLLSPLHFCLTRSWLVKAFGNATCRRFHRQVHYSSWACVEESFPFTPASSSLQYIKERCLSSICRWYSASVEVSHKSKNDTTSCFSYRASLILVPGMLDRQTDRWSSYIFFLDKFCCMKHCCWMPAQLLACSIFSLKIMSNCFLVFQCHLIWRSQNISPVIALTKRLTF